VSEQYGHTDPDTPVLVFRSESGRTEVARRAEGFSVHVLHGYDQLSPDEAVRLGSKLVARRVLRGVAPSGDGTPGVGCPSCGTILNASAAGCADLWHADNKRELDAEREKPAESGPLVLTLPEVPEGAVALITRNQDGDEVRFVPAPAHPGSWVMASGSPTGDWLLVEILRGFDGSVTVELAPPRTWPKLDELTEDIKTVRGASGRTYHQSHFAQSIPIFCEHTDDGRPTGPAIPFHALQTFDGPLTEVLDG
jgi:hypothetical protein